MRTIRPTFWGGLLRLPHPPALPLQARLRLAVLGAQPGPGPVVALDPRLRSGDVPDPDEPIRLHLLAAARGGRHTA